MQQVFIYIRDYAKWVNKSLLLLVTLFTATLIYFNYASGLEKKLTSSPLLPLPYFTGHYLLFIATFVLTYALTAWLQQKDYFRQRGFIILLLLAPAIFALKMSLDVSFNFCADEYWNEYWNHILFWPLRLGITGGILFLCWKFLQPTPSFYGLTTKDFNWKPYFIMLLIMVPLIAAAATQPDFQHTYPKLKAILPFPEGTTHTTWYMLLYELAYGTDFISIELFFRGFLILAFVKWAGKDAILPMACFYCSIHFGKPLGECISSYFGGLLLGIVIYNNRTILGGLMVHLGIAWLMELGGWLGNMYWK